jgi:hypothetical protein
MLLAMSDVVTRLREACAKVAESARHVAIEHERIALYAASLPRKPSTESREHPTAGSRENQAAFWLTLDAINFGSGWFPTLRKRAGSSGYHTIAAGLRERFASHGPWTAQELAAIEPAEIASVMGQDPGHELMALFAWSLNDLGRHLAEDHAGQFEAVVDAADGAAVALATRLGRWSSFADTSAYDGLELPFLKRAQIAAADLHRAGVAAFRDLDRLTMFADNLVPHVLRLDGVLHFDRRLTERIINGELIEHGSLEEVELRACALHAVELIVQARPHTTAAEIDSLLWNRGQQPQYKAAPRHRSRCTAY